MSHKTEFIKARVTKQTKQLFKQLAKQEKLSCSRLLRVLIHGFEKPVSISQNQRSELQENFTNTARIGGLLNQIAHHLNSNKLQVINGDLGFVELDAEKLSNTCNKLEKEVQKIKKMLTQISHEVA